ncbi:MAG: pyruvate, phosphate dikinase [Candidatus Aenigmatarchaeota archaeon]
MKPKQYVYFFGEGDTKNVPLLGNKGAQLGEMTNIGLPVPEGFTITTDACKYFYECNKSWPKGLQEEVDENMKRLESKMGFVFGDDKKPLLVSIRSGAALSMPGMLNTVLNLGLNEKTLQGLIKLTNNERFAWDSYRRFIQMFGDVVLDVEHKDFEDIISKKKKSRGAEYDTELDTKDLKEITEEFKKLIKDKTKKEFPTDVRAQLRMAIDAVFNSWNCTRAVAYRRINDLKGLFGTGVNVQAMVFGNMGDDCCTGVAFTRNPSTGENKFYGEYLINAQGEDVVAGIRTPQNIDNLSKDMPKTYKQLLEIRKALESHYRDMQDIEFTVQKGKLYMLQTREGKRTGAAAVRIAVEMVEEKLITKEDAMLRVKSDQLNQLLHKRINPEAKKKNAAIGKGLPASPGAAVGKVVFNAEDAVEWSIDKNEKVVLVRLETSPEDIEGMHVSEGILTGRGGMTSHAAVVARGMGKCCIAGCTDLIIDDKNKKFKLGGKEFKEGDFITLDGTIGEVYAGQLPVIDPEMSEDFATLMDWAKKTKKLEVRTNADSPHDAKIAKDFGAEGIGLCRTEHMFFEGERILAMREMILACNEEDRKKALRKLLPFQTDDFAGIFREMDGLPVIIRFLDPPLHEFLPKEDKEIKELSKMINVSEEKIRQRIDSLHEFNPMLGFRGCRLGIVYPEISEFQARAVFAAALLVKKEGKNPKPLIEIPNVIDVKEFKNIKDIIKGVAKEMGVDGKLDYQIGTMIEFPRAALTADLIAKEAEFMSFGTNDLTQTTLGFSRDDAGKFIAYYLDKGIFEKDPFQTLDQEGVGSLMKLTIEKAKSVKKDMDIGICGEHGGDSESVKFCHKIGLTNVSASPFRVPIAILAAAQAVILEKKKK